MLAPNAYPPINTGLSPQVTPSPAAIGAMNHIALPTADPERGAKFYCDVLGFVSTPRPAFSFRGAWLLHRAVGVMIHLIHDANFEPNLATPINSRTNHLAIHVDDYNAAVASRNAAMKGAPGKILTWEG